MANVLPGVNVAYMAVSAGDIAAKRLSVKLIIVYLIVDITVVLLVQLGSGIDNAETTTITDVPINVILLNVIIINFADKNVGRKNWTLMTGFVLNVTITLAKLSL